MSRCDFDGWSDLIAEVPRYLAMQKTVCHEAQFKGDSFWHIQSVQFVMQEC